MTSIPTERPPTLTDRVAEEIRAAMGRRRTSGAELARQLGVSQMWVSYRLNGRQPIDVNDLALIAGALGVRVLDLLPRELANEEPPPAPPTQRSRRGRQEGWRDNTSGYSRKPAKRTNRPPVHSNGFRRPASTRRPIAA